MDDRQSDYERLIKPIEDRMMRCVWRVVRDPEAAEEAFQEALLMVWKHWGKVQRHPNPHALVLRICINSAYDMLRRNTRQQKRQAADEIPEEVPDLTPSAYQCIADAEQNTEVFRAIAHLPRNQARAILMHVVGEIPYGEIAEAMDCREATVRKHVARARAKLRIVLSHLIPSARKEESIHA